MKITLHTNENPYPPHCAIRDAAIKGLDSINRYSEQEYLLELKDLLGNYCGLSADRIAVSHGSDQLIREFINIYSRNRRLLLVRPSFFPVSQYAISQSSKITRIQVSPPDFNLDIQLLIPALNEPTLIVLDNPNNPSGKLLLNDSSIEEILRNPNALVLVDEAYFEFSGRSFASLIPKYPNLAISRTMDKAFGLAGLRLGYLLLGDSFREYFASCSMSLSTPTLFAAIAALKEPDYMFSNVSGILSEKSRVEQDLTDLRFEVFPGDANFILVKSEIPDFARKLADENISIYNLADDWAEGYYRISIGLPTENRNLISAIQRI